MLYQKGQIQPASLSLRRTGQQDRLVKGQKSKSEKQGHIKMGKILAY